MDIRRMLALISDPIEKWHLTNADAEVYTLCVEEDGHHAGVDIHIGYSKPTAINTPQIRLSYYEATIQVPRDGEVIYKKPKRV